MFDVVVDMVIFVMTIFYKLVVSVLILIWLSTREDVATARRLSLVVCYL